MKLQNTVITTSLLLMFILMLSGCSLIMPYQEDFSCTEDLNAGNCKMVRDNYNN